MGALCSIVVVVEGGSIAETLEPYTARVPCLARTLVRSDVGKLLCLCVSVPHLKLRIVAAPCKCLLDLHGLTCVSTQDRVWRVIMCACLL